MTSSNVCLASPLDLILLAGCTGVGTRATGGRRRHTSGRSPADDYLFAYADVGGWVYYLEDLADSAAECAAADADPARAWDDEAWAAFTWRMQTSPAFSPTN